MAGRPPRRPPSLGDGGPATILAADVDELATVITFTSGLQIE